jgi:hypothetical protein
MSGHGAIKVRLNKVISAVRILTVALLGFAISSSCLAQAARIVDDFDWQKDKLKDRETASSRGDPSINFLDVGDLSSFSLQLVKQTLESISHEAGTKVDSNLKNAAIVIVHDTNVFSRLNADRNAFSVLGIPDVFIDQLQKKAAEDTTTTCINITINDHENNILLTAVLISEKFNSCLISGLFRAFGILSSNASLKALISVCVLYEGRRQGLRDRQSLVQETPRLLDLCMTKAAENE